MPNISFAPLHVALCALLLVGCTSGGTQGDGDVAGRQAPGAIPGDVATTTVLTIADSLRATGDLSAAVSFYRRALVANPHLVSAYLGLGESLIALGFPSEAAEAFRKATSEAQNEQASPERTSHEIAAKRGLGLALIALNQPIPAIELLNQANAAEPNPRGFSAIGVAQDLLGNPDAAEKAYQQGLALAPGDLDLQNNYGLSQALHGDYNNAISTLRRVASDSKATARHRLNLALVLGLAGRNEDAAQVARIDLDERSVRSNLAYYAELRALPAKARATAILRPGSPLHGDGLLANCEGPSCPHAELPGEKLAAIPTTPVDAKPLPATVGAKPTASSPTVAAPIPLTPPATAKPIVQATDPAEKKPTKPAKSVTTAAAKAPSAEPVHPAAHPATATAPAPAEPPVPTPAAPTMTQQSAKPAMPVVDAAPTPVDDAKPAAKVEVAAADAVKPADKVDDGNPATRTETEQPTLVAPNGGNAAADTATPTPTVDDAKPAMAGAEPGPARPPMADPSMIAAQEGPTPAPAPVAPNPSAALDHVKPAEQAEATNPVVDPAKPATADATLAAADGDPVPGALPVAPAPTPSEAMLPAGPVIKAAVEVPPLPPGKHAWIQIASFRSEQNAQSAWKNMTTGNQDLLRYVPLSVRRVDLGAEKGVFYVLRIGPLASMDQAHDLCAALKDRNITCMVAK